MVMQGDTTDYREHPEMKHLKETYPLNGLKLTTVAGLRWRNRMQASEAYFRDYSKRWSANQELYSGFDKMISKFGTYVAVPFSVVQNWVNDVYYRNPDPLVQDRSGNKDLGKILSDLFRTIHRESDSERKMKEALADQFWAGFGALWVSFRQDGVFDPEVFDFFKNEQGGVIPTKQQVLVTRISPWRIRFDPTGREWDLSDHSYLGVMYEQSLAQVMRDPTVSEDDRRRIMAHYGAGNLSSTYDPQQVRYATLATSFNEEDPEFIKIPFWQIWSRPDKQVYRLPLGSSFTLEPQPWNEEFAEADVFPLLYMAKNREFEDESRLQGFVGIPDFTLIEPHVRNINKLEALFMAANQHVINKYITYKGVLDQQAAAKLADGTKQFAVIELDKDALNVFPTEMRDKLSMKEVLGLVPQAELKELHHLEGIKNEFEMIWQIIGQGPADRGGVSEAGSATESLGMQQGLGRRMSAARHENGKNFCRLTKLFYLVLKARQTLPLRYQMTTAFNQQVWQEFSADALTDLDLHFEYAVGSSEYRTREQEFALRQQMAQVLMPIFQAANNTRLLMKVAQDLVEPLNILGSEQYFNDEASQIAMKLLAILRGLGKGRILADDPQAAKQIAELVAMLAQAILTPQQLAEVEAASAGAPAPEPEGEGSLPAPQSAGEASFEAGASGSAAAGAQGGLPN